MGWGRGNSVDIVWLKQSPQQAGLRGDGRDCPWCPCREVLHEPAGWDSLLLMQHVALAFYKPAPAPQAARHALAASLRLSLGIKCCLLPAEHLAPHSGCSRAPPSVPQPTLPSGLLSVWVQPQEASLQASQHCRNQDALVGLMFQERQELIIFQAQKNPEHLWLRPAISRIQRPCPKPAAVSVPSLFSPLSLSAWAKLCCRTPTPASRDMKGGGQQPLPHMPLESAAFEPPFPHHLSLAALWDAELAAGSAPLLGCWGKK